MAPAEMKTRLSATQGNREGAADERAAPSQDACPLPSPQADGRPHSSAAVHQLPQRPATAIRPLNTANQLHHERGAAPRGWFCVAHFLAPTHFFLPPPFPLPLPPLPRVTGGFLSFLGGISYQIRILLYRDVSCMYLVCILMCPVRIHQDTSRYIEIHQDTFVSVTLAIIGNVSYLGICILL